MSSRPEPFEKVPPHANAEVHERIMRALEAMTPEDIFQHAVSVGIYHPDGTLTNEYGGSANGSASTEAETGQ
jgi:hypothetical protein